MIFTVFVGKVGTKKIQSVVLNRIVFLGIRIILVNDTKIAYFEQFLQSDAIKIYNAEVDNWVRENAGGQKNALNVQFTVKVAQCQTANARLDLTDLKQYGQIRDDEENEDGDRDDTSSIAIVEHEDRSLRTFFEMAIAQHVLNKLVHNKFNKSINFAVRNK